MNVHRFKDRIHAGKLLAQQLAPRADRDDAIVLALPRGGVPVGFAVADALQLPLDVMVARKLGVPSHPELAMGAIAGGGQRVIRSDVVQALGITDEVIEDTARRELAELQRREALYRGNRPPPQLEGRTAILIDDGLATGATMMAAARTLRTRHPARIVIAVPVGAADTCRMLADEADEVVCLLTPEPFHAVSLWYDEFPQTGDDEVIDLLERARRISRHSGGRQASPPHRPHSQ
jgi:predicted phosphoribosyltransferase